MLFAFLPGDHMIISIGIDDIVDNDRQGRVLFLGTFFAANFDIQGLRTTSHFLNLFELLLVSTLLILSFMNQYMLFLATHYIFFLLFLLKSFILWHYLSRPIFILDHLSAVLHLVLSWQLLSRLSLFLRGFSLLFELPGLWLRRWYLLYDLTEVDFELLERLSL